MLFKLEFFKKVETGHNVHICADDFKNLKEIEILNLNFLLSLSNLKKFQTPFSGKYVGLYAVVTMSNNCKYFINEKCFYDLSESLKLL